MLESFTTGLSPGERQEVWQTIASWAETGPPAEAVVDRVLAGRTIYKYALPNGVQIKFFTHGLGPGHRVIDVSLVLMRDYDYSA
jgi:hypothetical protein